MSKVKSFRFNEYEENLINECTLRGMSSQQAIVNALEYYFENVINPSSEFDMVVNFDLLPNGVNNPLVDRFIREVTNGTNFKFKMYCDGDSVGFDLQENIYEIDKD